MLSFHKIGSAGEAGKYYEGDSNYYSQESGALEKSEWYGAGAAAMGLSGPVDSADFGKLLTGDIGNDVKLGRMVNGQRQHTPGWDLTFSAPKSVSIMALSPDGDKRLINAHDEAVKATLEHIEKTLIVARAQGENGVEYQATGNMTAALFQHATSRALDPQLHTHSVIQNMTVNDNGEWRSIVSQAFMKPNMKKTLGLFYRSTLAHNVKSLGYDLNIDHKKGFFEINGVPKELIKEQSKRRNEIEASAEERGLKGGKQMEKAALMTRRKKMKVSGETLDQVWKSELKDHKFYPSTLTEAASKKLLDDAQLVKDGQGGAAISGPDLTPKNKAVDRPPEKHKIESLEDATKFAKGTLQTVAQSVKNWFDEVNGTVPKSKTKDQQPAQGQAAYKATFPKGISQQEQERVINDTRIATAVFADREAAFLKDELIKNITQLSLGMYPPTAIEPAIKTLIGNGELVPSLLSTNQKFEAAFTTPEALRQEKYIIQTMEEGKGKVSPITDKNEVRSFISDVDERSRAAGFEHGLRKGQADAIELMATSTDRFIAIQGYAGVGKTFMQKEAKTLLERNGYEVRGFAPTGSAVASMQKESGIPSRTVDSFLYEMERSYKKGTLEDGSKQAWVVDEASLIASNNMASLMTFAQRTGARVILQGDIKQHGSVEWGRPFALMQQSGIQTASMSDIIRQENSELRNSVYHAIEGKISEAVESISSMFTEIEGDSHEEQKQATIAAASKSYTDLSPEQRENTLLVIPDNETRMKVMRSVRDELVGKGEISKEGVEMTSLVTADLTPVQKKDVRYYESGMVLEFNQDYKRDIVADKGDRLKVTSIDPIANTLKLQSADGKVQTWNPKNVSKRGLDVFKEESIALSKNDKVIWKRTNKSEGMVNGDRGEVISVDAEKNTATVKFSHAGERTLDLTKDRHLMWSYATTSFSAQGMTVSHVVGVLDSYRRNVVNQKSFYVTLSRAKHSVQLFTDDKQKLAKEVKNRLGDKTSALETVGHFKANNRQSGNKDHDPTASPYVAQMKEQEVQREATRQANQNEREQRQNTISKQRVM